MKILALLGAIQGIVLFLYILPSKKNKKANLNFLIGIFLCITQMLLVSYVQNPNAPEGNLYLKLITWILPFAAPVFIYFHFRFLLGEQHYKKRDFLFFIPTALATIAVLPYLFKQPFSANPWEQIDPFIFAQQGLIHAFLYAGIIVVFGKRMYMLHEDYKAKILNLYSNFQMNQLTWIQGNALGITIIGVTGFIAAIVGLGEISQPNADVYNIWYPHYLMFVPICILFYWHSYKVIQAPELFRFVEEVNGKAEKYSHSTLDDPQASQLARRLRSVMDDKKLYLNANLKLSDVAEELGVSKQILSQLINQHFKQNFFDFINAYRIKVAKENLLNPKLSSLTIQGIAQESGFKSKSTFYDVFKKNTGVTPKQFQRQ